MRRIAIIAAVAATMLPSAGFAQQSRETVPSAPTVGVAPSAPAPTTMPRNSDVVPEQGGPLHPAAQTGRDIVADDSVSTKTVGAVPCTTAARETDGTTTCIGIPSARERKR